MSSGKGCCRTFCLVFGIEKSTAEIEGRLEAELSERLTGDESFFESTRNDPDLLVPGLEDALFLFLRLLFLLNLRQSSFRNLHSTPTTKVVMVTTNAMYPIKGLYIPGSLEC